MNYAAHYDRLIDRARRRVLHGCVERHHVVPRCMDGSDAPENIVQLTPEEHFVAHQLLVRIHPGVAGLVHAAVLMAQRCSGNKVYGWLRRRHSSSRIGRPLSKEHCAKLSAASRGKPKSLQHRRNMSAATRGRTKSPESVAKTAAGLRGRRLTQEHRAKISAAQFGKKRKPFTRPPHTLETRAKMSAARFAFWERKRATA